MLLATQDDISHKWPPPLFYLWVLLVPLVGPLISSNIASYWTGASSENPLQVSADSIFPRHTLAGRPRPCTTSRTPDSTPFLFFLLSFLSIALFRLRASNKSDCLTVMPPRLPLSAAAAARAVEAQAVARTTGPSSQQQTASFSSTPTCDYFSKTRRNFREWLKTDGAHFKAPPEEGPRYLSPYLSKRRDYKEGRYEKQRPFPTNPGFRIAKVLNERARQTIWTKIMQEGETIKAVSAEYGIDVRRVAAVIRLQEVEKDWVKQVSTRLIITRPHCRSYCALLLPSTLASLQ